MPRAVIAALECLGPQPGGSGAHLYRVAGDGLFVVKFKGSQHGKRIVVNDYVAGRLAEELRLPIGNIELINVPLELHPTHAHLPRTDPGTQFGMLYFPYHQAFPPKEALVATKNFTDFAGVMVFDTWVLRRDGRQLLIYSSASGGPYEHFAIFDHGFCFGGEPNWTVESLGNNEGTFDLQDQYGFIKSHFRILEHFRPYLEGLRGLNAGVIEGIFDEFPAEEWGVAQEELKALLRFLTYRREMVADRIAGLLT